MPCFWKMNTVCSQRKMYCIWSSSLFTHTFSVFSIIWKTIRPKTAAKSDWIFNLHEVIVGVGMIQILFVRCTLGCLHPPFSSPLQKKFYLPVLYCFITRHWSVIQNEENIFYRWLWSSPEFVFYWFIQGMNGWFIVWEQLSAHNGPHTFYASTVYLIRSLILVKI